MEDAKMSDNDKINLWRGICNIRCLCKKKETVIYYCNYCQALYCSHCATDSIYHDHGECLMIIDEIIRLDN